MKENETEKKLSNSMFLNDIASSFLSDFPKIIQRGVARFFHFRVAFSHIFHICFPGTSYSPESMLFQNVPGFHDRFGAMMDKTKQRWMRKVRKSPIQEEKQRRLLFPQLLLKFSAKT